MPRLMVQVLAIVIAVGAIAAIVFVPGMRSDVDAGDDTTNAAEVDSNPTAKDNRPRVDVQPSGQAVGTQVGNKAPHFELTDPQGNTHRLSDYLGQVVVLDFWGTWCAPCRRVMPALQSIHEKYHERGVNMIGISCNEPPQGDPVGFMAKNNYDYGLLLDGEKVTKFYGVTGYPTLMVIGVDGEILYSHRGAAGDIEAQISSVVDQHLAVHGL